MCGTGGFQPFQESGLWRDAPHVAGDRFDDDGGHLTVVFTQQCFDGLEVVVGGKQGVFRRALGDPGRAGCAKRDGATSGLDEERVGVPVVAAGELHNLFPPRESSGQSNGTHACLGAGVDHSDLVDVRNHLTNELRNLRFQFCGGAKRRPLFRRALHGVNHRRVGVSQDLGPPGIDVVDVGVAVDVAQVRAQGALHVNGVAAHRLERPNRRVHAARDGGLGFGEEGRRTLVDHVKGVVVRSPRCHALDHVSRA